MTPLEHNDLEQQVDWGARARGLLMRAKLLLRRWWWVVLLCASAGVVLQTYRQLQVQPSYVSQARLIISGMVTLPDGNAYREEFANFFGTQIELMQSGRVRERATLRLRMMRPELQHDHASLSARQQPDTTIFVLWARGANGPYVQAYLDAVVEEYLNLRREMRTHTSETAVVAVTEQLVRLQEDISTFENALVDFQRQNNLVFIQNQGSTAGEYLVRLKNQQADLRTQLRMIEALGLSSQMDDSPVAASSREMVEVSPVQVSSSYIEGRAALERLEAQLREFSTYLKPRHPKIITLTSEVGRMRNLLKIYEEDALANLEERKRILRAKIENLEFVIADWESKALENSRKLAEYDRLRSRLDRARDTYQRLLASTETINLSKDLEIDTVTVLESATHPWEEKQSFVKNVVQGGMTGTFLGIGILVLLGTIDTRVITADDLRRRFEAPVLAIIPLERRNEQRRIELLRPKDARHLFAEACRTLRSSLLFLQTPEGQPVRTVAVTSAVPEEGKSTISSNLAVALSFTSSRTILIDGDLRRGFLARHMGMAASPGLSDLLQGRTTLERTIYHTSYENLDFMPAGEHPERPGELLLSQSMDTLLVELQTRYDFVIIDTAPILATDDTTGFANRTDGVLFVVRSGHAQSGQVKASLDRLGLRGARVPGFVLNCVDVRGSDYYYYKKYNDYYAPRGDTAVHS